MAAICCSEKMEAFLFGFSRYHSFQKCRVCNFPHEMGGGPRVVVSTAAFHAIVRGSVPGLGGLKETKMFLHHPRVKVSIVESLRESCVWRTVSSQSSHHPQEVLLAQFSLYVHKGGLKPDSFHFLTKNQRKYRYWHSEPDYQANTKYLYNICITPAQLLRR